MYIECEKLCDSSLSLEISAPITVIPEDCSFLFFRSNKILAFKWLLRKNCCREWSRDPEFGVSVEYPVKDWKV